MGWLPSLCILLVPPPSPVETEFVQVAPSPKNGPALVRSANQNRAVVLISGLRIHPPGSKEVAKPHFTSWQKPNSVLVQTLSAEADVFAFAYGQTVPVTEIASLPGLGDGIGKLRELGYQQIVLVGFSAGGLVARQFVEDQPDVGATKVIQVCSPNGGSGWAKGKLVIASSQMPFVQSLSKEDRARWLASRREKTIPEKVQFACIVGTGLGYGDGIVSLPCQWTEDLQRQGIPVALLRSGHLKAIRKDDGAHLVAELVREKQPRWDATQVQRMRDRLGAREKVEP